MLNNYWDPNQTEQTKTTAGLVRANQSQLLRAMKMHTTATTNRVEHAFQFFFNTLQFITTGTTNFDSRLDMLCHLHTPQTVPVAPSSVSSILSHAESLRESDFKAETMFGNSMPPAKLVELPDFRLPERNVGEFGRSTHSGRSNPDHFASPSRFVPAHVPRRALSDTDVILAAV
jgi:hypothetical protein